MHTCTFTYTYVHCTRTYMAFVHTHTLSHSLYLSHSLSHTHACTHTCIPVENNRFVCHTRTRTHSPSLSVFLSLSLFLSLYVSLSLALSLSYTLTHTHTHQRSRAAASCTSAHDVQHSATLRSCKTIQDNKIKTILSSLPKQARQSRELTMMCSYCASVHNSPISRIKYRVAYKSVS